MFIVERDPKKRRVKPVETQASILDFDLEESSDDSDFRIEDHAEVTDDDEFDSNVCGGEQMPICMYLLIEISFCLFPSHQAISERELNFNWT